MPIDEAPRYLFSDRPLNIIADGITYVGDARMDEVEFSAQERASGYVIEDQEVLARLFRPSVGLDALRRLNSGDGIGDDIQATISLSESLERLINRDAAIRSLSNVTSKAYGFFKTSGAGITFCT